MWLWIVIVAAAVWWLVQQAGSIGVAPIGTVDFGTGDGPQPWGANVSANIADWAMAITNFEGGKPGDLNVRNNNPGNLRVTGAPGQIGNDSRGFAIFSSWADGMNALLADLSAKVRKYPTYTLTQIMQRYAPSSDNNNPNQYANYIAAKLGVSASDTLQSIFKG